MLLNVYCSRKSQEVFYKSKESSMIERCQLAASAISDLEVINKNSVAQAVVGMGSLRVSRMIVSDHNGFILYDSSQPDLVEDQYIILPEIKETLVGNDVFTWQYHDGLMRSQASVPIYSYGTLLGCVYMTEYDMQQGFLIQSLQRNILWITIFLECAIILFSLSFSYFSNKRLQKIIASMRSIHTEEHSKMVDMGGKDELTMLGNEFNSLIHRLQTSENQRRQFVSDASHELKTPLASIKLLSDSILQNNMDNETMMEFVKDIGDEAERLNRMSHKLLSLSKAESQLELDCEIIQIAPTVQKVVRMLSATADDNNITIVQNIIQDSTILVQDDDLYQIIFNLVENGIKYNISGGTLTISLSRDDDNACLTVADTGVGISEESVKHIFDRFYRVDKARSRRTGGSGLGLSIVKSLTERNGGEISVSSEVGKGTVFTVLFPVFDTEEDEI